MRWMSLALVLIIAAGSLAIVVHNLALGVVAVVVLLMLVASAMGAGRVAARCSHLKGQAVKVRVWGTAPSAVGQGEVVVKRIWALGAGLHFDVATNGGASVHIKIAQPREWSIQSDSLTIAEAKYVQVAGADVGHMPGCPAIQLVRV